MKEIFSVVIVICACSLICTLVSSFVTQDSTKKILNLVLGAFIVCSLFVPAKNAVSSLGVSLSQYESEESIISTDDEAYNEAVLNQTKVNLEKTATDLLLQNNIKANNCKIILADNGQNSIIISSISIYISKEYVQTTDLISRIIEDNFGLVPNIFTE